MPARGCVRAVTIISVEWEDVDVISTQLKVNDDVISTLHSEYGNDVTRSLQLENYDDVNSAHK